jgi:23S rRNA (cytidine1920-2'-O)/16S rRNA (cytidine1409-2'-O)-methyltransferase
VRLDLALVERGLVRSRNQAARLIESGHVLLNGIKAAKPSIDVDETDSIEVTKSEYVARSAHKLLYALDQFGIKVPSVCLDIGASTGGFTQVLLEQGADRVIALDVGTDQLADELKHDHRVIEMSGVNIRDFDPAELPFSTREIGLVVVDLSFISLRLVAESILNCGPQSEFVFLIKPQFEVQKADLNRQGVLISETRRLQALRDTLEALSKAGFSLKRLSVSPITGSAGNIEYLAHLAPGRAVDIDRFITELD